MDYAKLNGEYYLRVDPGEELLASIAKICEREKIYGAHFQGIGACGEITLSTYLPDKKDFMYEKFSGMFEIISLIGNVTSVGGHLKSAHTAEIIIRPANSAISQRFDIVPDVGVWDFGNEKI